MIGINENFLKLRAGYLFPEIGRRVRAFKQEHPQAKVISMGIGDVTQPLAPAVIEAMHRAVDEMGRQETAGRPILYGTTFEFLQNFGLRGVEDLPPLEQAAETILTEAINEAQAAAQAVAERIK